MAFRHGKSTRVLIGSSDLSTYFNDTSVSTSVETAETTTYGVAGDSKTYVTGLNDSTISISGKFDSTVDAHLAGVLGQDATLSFEYGPAGSTVGYIKFTGEAIMTKYDLSSPVGDVVSFSCDFQITGEVTRDTY
jgi:predicted secreted protein